MEYVKRGVKSDTNDHEISLSKDRNLDIKDILMDLQKIEKFDTDGFDEYNIEGFQKKIIQSGIRPKEVLEKYLTYLVKEKKDKDFSTDEMHFHMAMRAWLHCDYENAMSFIKENFNFECVDNIDFAKKYKFLNLVSVLILANRYVDEKVASRTPIVANERSVFNSLKESLNKSGNSFLLNYFAKDFYSVSEKQKHSVMGDVVEFKPFVIAPKIFAMDSNSHFSSILKNDLADTLYISKPEDYEKINTILETIPNGKFISQEVFDKVSIYFYPVQIQGVVDNQSLDMQIYRKLNDPYHRQKIKEVTGIDIQELPISEQFYFLDYLKLVSSKDLQKVIDFNKKFSTTGLRTFLSLEKGGKEMGDKILSLGERLSHESAEILFAKYGSIVDTAFKAGETLSKLLPIEVYTSSQERLSEIKDSLMNRAKDLLIKYYEEGGINEAEMSKALGRYNEEIFLFAETYKSFANSGNKIEFEDILSTQIKILSVDERKEKGDLLWEINKENRKAFITDKTEMDKREARFRQTLADQKVSFYDLEHNGKVVGFCSFELLQDGTLLAESLNVEEEIKSTKVGGDFFKILVERLSKEHPIVGYVHEGNAGTLPYYERIGFKVSSKEEKDGRLFYKIIHPKIA